MARTPTQLHKSTNWASACGNCVFHFPIALVIATSCVAVVGCAGIVDLHNTVLVDHADQALRAGVSRRAFATAGGETRMCMGPAHSLSAFATPFFSGGVNAQVRFLRSLIGGNTTTT